MLSLWYFRHHIDNSVLWSPPNVTDQLFSGFLTLMLHSDLIWMIRHCVVDVLWICRFYNLYLWPLTTFNKYKAVTFLFQIFLCVITGAIWYLILKVLNKDVFYTASSESLLAALPIVWTLLNVFCKNYCKDWNKAGWSFLSRVSDVFCRLLVLFKPAAMMLQDVGSDYFVIRWVALINNGAFSRISITGVVPVRSLKDGGTTQCWGGKKRKTDSAFWNSVFIWCEHESWIVSICSLLFGPGLFVLCCSLYVFRKMYIYIYFFFIMLLKRNQDSGSALLWECSSLLAFLFVS